MKKSKNKVLILMYLLYDLVISIITSVFLLFTKDNNSFKNNSIITFIHFILHIWPKSFWNNPSGIKIWRSIWTLINFIFYRENNFYSKKDKKTKWI